MEIETRCRPSDMEVWRYGGSQSRRRRYDARYGAQDARCGRSDKDSGMELSRVAAGVATGRYGGLETRRRRSGMEVWSSGCAP